jgi:hypothetical protein
VEATPEYLILMGTWGALDLYEPGGRSSPSTLSLPERKNTIRQYYIVTCGIKIMCKKRWSYKTQRLLATDTSQNKKKVKKRVENTMVI